jgi:hypothetical protein
MKLRELGLTSVVLHRSRAASTEAADDAERLLNRAFGASKGDETIRYWAVLPSEASTR